jgi:hypothetical protein
MDDEAILKITMAALPDAAVMDLLLHGQAMTRYEINKATGVTEAAHVPLEQYRTTPAEIEARLNVAKRKLKPPVWPRKP